MRPPAVVVVIQAIRGLLHCWTPCLHSVRPFAGLIVGPQGKSGPSWLYNEQVRVAQEFTNDSDQLSTALRTLVARGYGSRLNDALMRSIALWRCNPKSDAASSCVFDSRDDGSENNQRGSRAPGHNR